MRKFGLGLTVLALSSACFLAGCEPNSPADSKLKVGTVDIMRVMEERPETRAIRLDWATQAGDTYMRLSQVKDSVEAEELQKEIEESSLEWQKRMDAFMEESVELVEKETAEIAKERGIDLVVVDNPITQTVRYRDGEDLTLDVSLKLQN